MENSLASAPHPLRLGGIKEEMGPEGNECGHTRTTPEILVVMETSCVFTLAMSTSCLWQSTIVLQDATLGGNWVKSTWDFSVLFLAAPCVYNYVERFNLKKNGYIKGFAFIFFQKTKVFKVAFYFIFCFLGLHLWHMKFTQARDGIKAAATPQPQQSWMDPLNPRSRVQTHEAEFKPTSSWIK